MMKPMVSVVIPTCNCAAFIQETLESVFAQTYPDYEIIVADSSMDETPAIVQRYGSRVTYSFQPPEGAAAQRNVGMQKAQGAYVAFLDGDDVWEPERLATQVAALNAHPEAVLAFSDFRKFGAPEGSEAEPPARFQKCFREWVARHRMSCSDISTGWLHAVLVRGNVIPTSSVLLRRAAALGVGLFDERFAVAEDYEYWLRLSLRFPVVYVDRVLEAYRVRDTGLSGVVAEREMRFASAHIAVLEKHAAEAHAELSAAEREIIRRRIAALRYRVGASRMKAGDARAAFREVGRALQTSKMLGLEFADEGSTWRRRSWLALKPYAVWLTSGLSSLRPGHRASGAPIS